MHRALLLALIASTTLAACGGDDSSSESPEAPAEAQSGTVAVGMNRSKFDPDAITVKTGSKVVWTNNENVPHDVKATEGADFKSEVFGQDGTFEYTTDAPGEISYVCTLHAGMDGTITVVD